MDYQGLKIDHFVHDTVRITGDFGCLYIDPYQLSISQVQEADLVLITHHHFDHCSQKDLEKIVTSKTKIIGPRLIRPLLNRFSPDQITIVAPNQAIDFDGVKIITTPAYNINKFRSAGLVFHPAIEGSLGYVVEINNVRFYHAGDTDVIPEMKNLGPIDVAFLPVSGTYVMTWQEALEAVQLLQPKIVVPIHYGNIIGSKQDAENFKNGTKVQVELI